MRAIIFDLDNCLAAADEPGAALFAPVFAAIRNANHGTLTDEALDSAFRDCWVHAFDVVAARHDFSGAMRAAGWRALLDVEMCEPMVGYGDLDELANLGERRFLVTSGFRRLQESKVRALGIASLFDEVVIDAIDEAEHPGKEKIFLDLMGRYNLDPADVVVVGDNPQSELAVARRLGLRGVQILRPGVEPAENVSERASGLSELRRLLSADKARAAAHGPGCG